MPRPQRFWTLGLAWLVLAGLVIVRECNPPERCACAPGCHGR